MKTLKKLFSVLLIVIFFIPLFSQDLLKYRFSRKEWSKLNAKKLILKKKAVKGAPWPEVKVYALIDASPEESMAVYFDFPKQKNYIPGLLKSKPSKYITPTDIYVDFEVNLAWPLANSKFTTGNQLKKFKTGGYQIHWYPVKHTAAKDCKGDITFLPYSNKTLMIYRNFTFPKSSLASLFKSKMYKSVKRTVKAIVKRIEEIKGKQKTKMEKYIKDLSRALNGEYIFKDIAGK